MHGLSTIKKRDTIRGYGLLAAFSLPLLTITVYLPALQNGFVNWDDMIYVYNNENIRSIDIDFVKWSFSNASVGHWQPVTWLSLSLDYAFWGLNPLGFHLTNIILHSVNTLLVFILAIRLIKEGTRAQLVMGSDYAIGRPAGSPLRTANDELRIVVAAFVTALLFGIHPVHVESVAWVTERKDVLSTLFFLMALLSYLKYNSTVRSEKKVYYCVTLILFIIALMTKPMVIALPVVLLILDFYTMQRLGKGKDARWILIEKIPFFLLSFISSLITIWAAKSAEAMGNEISVIPRLFISARGYIFYLLKMSFPINLAPLYPYPAKIDIFTVEYLGSALLVLSLTIYCLWSLRRRRLIFAVWFYYLVTLVPVIGVVHAGPQDTADRYTYLPSIGPFLLIGLAIGTVLKWYPKRVFSLTMLLILLSGILIGKTISQIEVWHDSITLWTSELRLFPNVSIAHDGMGEAYAVSGNYQLALRELNKAIKLDVGIADFYYNRGIVHYKLGNYQQAIKDYSVVLERRKNDKKVYIERGLSYVAIREYGEGIKDFNRAIELNPRDDYAYGNRGDAYSGLGDYEKAIKDYTRAIELNPKYDYAYGNRGIAYYGLGDYEKAIKDYNRAIELNPEDKSAYGNRGNAQYGLGDYEKAISDYNRAIELAPQNAEVYYNLGLAYSRLGDSKQALTYFKKGADLGSKDAKEYLDRHGR